MTSTPKSVADEPRCPHYGAAVRTRLNRLNLSWTTSAFERLNRLNPSPAAATRQGLNRLNPSPRR